VGEWNMKTVQLKKAAQRAAFSFQLTKRQSILTTSSIPRVCP
jgi:hypothetical protein